MWFSRFKAQMPAAESALPGRAEPMPVPTAHAVTGARLAPPFPEGTELALFGMGCFWGAERVFWTMPGVYSTAVGYAGGFTPNPTYEEVCSGLTGHAEVVRVVFDPTRLPYEALLRTFWESHDPTQGMRQGNDVGTQYRSAIYTHGDAQRAAARGLAGRVRARPARGPPRRHHHGDRRGGRVLLRGGVPPAVPRQESVGLLRHRGHRRALSGGRRRDPTPAEAIARQPPSRAPDIS